MRRMLLGWSVVGGVVLVLAARGCASQRAPARPATRESTPSVTRGGNATGPDAPASRPSSRPSSKPSVVASTQEAPFVKLWNGTAPGALGEEKSDTPAVQIYLPTVANRTGAAMVGCPGGGYRGLAAHGAGGVGAGLA